MKKTIHFLFLLLLLVFVGSCSDDDVTEAINSEVITITNTSQNELNVKSTETVKVDYVINLKEKTSSVIYDSFEFTSSNSDVFEVSNEGIVTGKRNGTAILTVSAISKDNKEAKGSCVVRVTGQSFVEKIEISSTLRNVRINVNENVEFQIEESEYKVLPENAFINEVAFASSNPEIASVDENGLIKGISGGVAIVSILSTDGSNVKAEVRVNVLAPVNTWYLKERRLFVFDYRSGLIKHPLNADGSGYGNKWEYLIDEGSNWQSSFISLTKPGKSGVPDSKNEIFIPVDMQQVIKFNQIYIRHRTTLRYARLKMWAFDLHGSDDGINFEVLEENVEIPNAKIDSSEDAYILLDSVYKYRYIKIEPSDWDTALGGTMQISDLKIGYDEERDPDFGI